MLVRSVFSEVDGSSPCVFRDMSQRFTLAFKCEVISEVQNGNTPSDVARKHGIDEDEILKWMEYASTPSDKLQAQRSSRTYYQTKYDLSVKYAAIMDCKHTPMSCVAEKRRVPHKTLTNWLRQADVIKHRYANEHDGQLQSEDKCSSRATVEPTTDAPLDPRTNVTLQQRSTALPDDALVRSDHTVAVNRKSPAQLDAPVVTPQSNDVSVSLYSDAYRLCGSIEDMMALHGIYYG